MERKKQMMERRKEMMERMRSEGSGGGLSGLMSQMMRQRGMGQRMMGDQRGRSALLQKMKQIDQQLDRMEEKLDKLAP